MVQDKAILAMGDQ